ncbi:MAG: 2Fe-2S iron-sulfur cluster-binding protein [Pigmentiphaga sp.]
MPLITFVKPDGTRLSIEMAGGDTLLRAAMQHGIQEIYGDCCGACCCATCHVYLEAGSSGLVPPPAAMETEVLELAAAPRRVTSRLACQVVLQNSPDTLVVQLPDRQV